jgi:hypothetical protein
MNQKSVTLKQAISSATGLLIAQWIIAIVSIPSAQDYATKLAAGTEPSKIVTLYDNFSFLITVTLVWSWLITNRFLLNIFDEVTKFDPNAIRLKRVWVTWGWIAPIVSFWFPKRIVDDLVSANSKRLNQPNPIGKASTTWWMTWIGYVLLNDLTAFNAITGQSSPIQPSYEIAAACMLTASYMVWVRILRSLDILN